MTNKIRAILKRLRRLKAGGCTTPFEVPDGHVAVYVGKSRKRYVLLATYLNHPIFKRLLADAEEEYGFPVVGPLAIPCDESLFDEFLAFVSRSTHQPFLGICQPQGCSHVGIGSRNGESRPLLNGVADGFIVFFSELGTAH